MFLKPNALLRPQTLSEASLQPQTSGVLPPPSSAAALTPELSPKPGDAVVRIDPRYFRPTEVETLLGDPTKAKENLGWEPRVTFQDLVSEMVHSDLEEAQRDHLCSTAGFRTYNQFE